MKVLKLISFALIGVCIGSMCLFIYDKTTESKEDLSYMPDYMVLKDLDAINDSSYVVNLSAKYEPNVVSSNSNVIYNNNYYTYNTYNEYASDKDLSQGDKTVISYLSEKVDGIKTGVNTTSLKEGAKNAFTSTVDFLFYGGTIKGYTFKDLTSKGKLAVIKLAIKLEDKIDQYFPGLIDGLSEKYQNAKAKIIELYEEKTNEFCMQYPDNCGYAIEDYNQMKASFGNAFSIFKNAGKSIASKTSEWYRRNCK